MNTNEIWITLPERFTFQSHRQFRAGYSVPGSSQTIYVVDFGHTHFIDSAGLGMLLQLVEHANNDPRRVRLVNCTAGIQATLAIAGFEQGSTLA